MPRGKKSSGQRKRKGARRSGDGGRRGADERKSNVLNQTKLYPTMAPNRKQLGGFPGIMRNTLKYVSNIVLNGETVTSPYVFQVNGLYDPDITSTGHQPSNYDVWKTIYRTWCVTDARFTMQLCPRGDANSNSYYGFIVTEDSSVVSSSTGTNELMEQPFSMYSATPGGDGYSNLPQGPLTARIPIHTWFGAMRSVMVQDPTCRGTASANPTRPLYAVMWASPVNGGTGNGSINFRVEIEFDVVWMEPTITVHSLVAGANKQAGPQSPVPTLAPERGEAGPLEERKEPSGGPPLEDLPKLMGGAEAPKNSRGWFG